MASTIDVKIPASLYKKLDAKEYTQALRRGINQATKIVQDEAEVYPKKRPGQRYIRTFNLRRSWNNRRVTVRASTVEGRVYSNTNTAPYNAYVQHPRYQAWMHRGRWQTTDDIARKKQKEVARLVEDEVRRTVSKP